MHVTAEEVIERLPHTQRRSVCPTLGNMTEDFLSGRYYDRHPKLVPKTLSNSNPETLA